MNGSQAIGVGWLVIGANAAWLSWDAFERSDAYGVFVLATAGALFVASSSAFSKADWSGFLLAVSSVLLALLGVMFLVGSVGCGHGCGSFRPVVNATGYVSFFLVPPLAIAGFIVGFRRALKRDWPV